jgi:hypothetical protein|tara:strand:- start:2061 stop:2375 length:315 start_codon:yes stop_codon:yes gene_type:complete
MPRVKKRDTNTIRVASSFTDWSIRRTVDEAANVARWNPPIALQWFEEAASRLDISMPEYMDYYDKHAKRTNKMLSNLETYRWYDKKNYWGDMAIRRVPMSYDNS